MNGIEEGTMNYCIVFIVSLIVLSGCIINEEPKRADSELGVEESSGDENESFQGNSGGQSESSSLTLAQAISSEAGAAGVSTNRKEGVDAVSSSSRKSYGGNDIPNTDPGASYASDKSNNSDESSDTSNPDPNESTGCSIDLPKTTGSVAYSQKGDIKLNKSIVPVYIPTGDFDGGYALPNIYVADGCGYDDVDCIMHISFDCGRFSDGYDGAEEEQYIGAGFLNQNNWSETNTWYSSEPTKLVGEFRGSGVLSLYSFGEEREIVLSNSYQKLELVLDFNTFIYNQENPKLNVDPSTVYADEKLFGSPASISLEQNDIMDGEEIIWMNVKNLKFVDEESGEDSSQEGEESSVSESEDRQALCGTFEGSIGYTSIDEWDGEIALDWNISPMFLPSGVFEDGAHQNAGVALSEGCFTKDGDCEVEFAETDCQGVPDGFWMGAAFLNNNNWDALFPWKQDPNKLVGYVKGSGEGEINSMGENITLELTEEYTYFELDLSSAIISETGSPVYIAFHEGFEYVLFKNLRFQ